MDGQNYAYSLDLFLRFVGAAGALVAAYVEPNPAVWLAAGGAAFLCPAVGKDRSPLELVRRVALSTLAGIFGSQLVAYMTHIPAPPTAFILAWIGPDLLGGVRVAAGQGEFGPRAIIGAFLDHLTGRGNKT